MRKSDILLVFSFMVIGLAIGGYYLIEYIENEAVPLPILGQNMSEEGTLETHTIPSFEFIDQLNNNFSDKDIEGKIWVADYFFTSCPTICPKMTKSMQRVHELYWDDDMIHLLSFTIDPKRDTPIRLKSYAEKYSADHSKWHFLTGEKTALFWLARKGFFVSATEGSNEYDFIHSENLVLVDPQRRIRGYYNGTDDGSVKQLIKDIAKLKREKA